MCAAKPPLSANTGALPEPCQLLICHNSTPPEEVAGFVKRCFGAPDSRSLVDALFCVVHVERLPFELHTRLIQEIAQRKFGAVSLGDKADSKRSVAKLPHLAVLYCGRQNVLAGLAARPLTGLLDSEVHTLMETKDSRVRVFSSDRPASGKSEAIRTRAHADSVKAKPFPISGVVDVPALVTRMEAMQLRSFEALHLELGQVTNVDDLNEFLFQLLVVGAVRDGARVFHLSPRTFCYIEIANTLHHALLDQLAVSVWFPHKRQLFSLDNYLPSSEPLSSDQIVCTYLHRREQLYLEDVKLPAATALPAERCRELMKEHCFPVVKPTSFAMIHTYMSVLAVQLIRFSKSVFFSVDELGHMVGPNNNIRPLLLQCLMRMALEFSTCSVRPAQARQSVSLAVEHSNSEVNAMIERTNGIVRWNDSNHLMVLFNASDSNTISALYADINKVDEMVLKLLKSQLADVADFSSLSPEKLRDRLLKLVRAAPSAAKSEPYALTKDNFLKMALIMTRVTARVPVVIMGETGCGKTSLIRFLSEVAGVPRFDVLNLHAGVTESKILQFVADAERAAQEGPVWAFLDEINACDHLGLIAELICHRSALGRPLHNNLTLIAACNPYRLRTAPQPSAGLELKQLVKSKLVYLVRPLPEALLDFVWDYGSLDMDNERKYIQTMVSNRAQPKLLIDLLFASQAFMRKREDVSVVSLRDVHRCLELMAWFEKDLPERKDSQHSAMILALAHCYLCRLADSKERRKLREVWANLLIAQGRPTSADEIAKTIRDQQLLYVNRMKLPPGTAANEALVENIFVLLVCIRNRLPVFVVGKPGSSKSLSMQIIRDNMRGPSSEIEYFRQLPTLVVISYQGSDSSTSDGILHVFKEARDMLRESKGSNTLPVVLLDEVGLAETSKNNPLKVLHELLEPAFPKDRPDVSVVGISNWQLDGAKMNRAIHLARPDLSAEALFETSLAIRAGMVGNSASAAFSEEAARKRLQALSDAYFAYVTTQPVKNFHGLRDFYSMIKALTKMERNASLESLVLALQRNFGGLPRHTSNMLKHFVEHLEGSAAAAIDLPVVPVQELIRANLEDPDSRHLLVSSDSAAGLSVLADMIAQLKRSYVVIHGSQFPNDLTEEYASRMLSRIILCMEMGHVLILKEVQGIHGNLYDMLNQSFTVVGGKRFCRIALGAHANPMCRVHENFRCIMLMSSAELAAADPPFLNRFEKQLLSYDDILEPFQTNLVEELKLWASDMAHIADGRDQAQFDSSDVFIGLHANSIPAVVHLICKTAEVPSAREKCQEKLLDMACADGIARAQWSSLGARSKQQLQFASQVYEAQRHRSLADLLSLRLLATAASTKSVVVTFSSISIDINACLPSNAAVEVDKLAVFKSERDLTQRLQKFFHSNSEMLVLQADAERDSAHLHLTKVQIDDCLREAKSDAKTAVKHVCIVLHSQRHSFQRPDFVQLDCLNGWNLVTVDVLAKSDHGLVASGSGSLGQALTSNALPFRLLFLDCAHWAFLCMKQPTRDHLQRVKRLIEQIADSELVCDTLRLRIAAWLEDKTPGDWRRLVACDRQQLLLNNDLGTSLLTFVQGRVREPLAMLFCELERLNALELVAQLPSRLLELWCAVAANSQLLDISSLAAPKGADSFEAAQPLALRFPFSRLLFDQLQPLRRLHAIQLDKARSVPDALDAETGELTNDAFDVVQQQFAAEAVAAVPLLAIANQFCGIALDSKGDSKASDSQPVSPQAPWSKEAMDAYKGDFLTFSFPDAPSSKLLVWAFDSLKPDNAKLDTPLQLHELWWTSSVAHDVAALLSLAAAGHARIPEQTSIDPNHLAMQVEEKMKKIEIVDNKQLLHFKQAVCSCYLESCLVPRKTIPATEVQAWTTRAAAVLDAAFVLHPEVNNLVLLLRLLRDLAANVLVPMNLNGKHLQLLSGHANQNRDGYFASTACINDIGTIVTALRNSAGAQHSDRVDRFECAALARCFTAVLEAPLQTMFYVATAPGQPQTDNKSSERGDNSSANDAAGDFDCCVCCHPFTAEGPQAPVVLSCSHTLCQTCASKMKSCPLCRGVVSGKPGANRLAQELIKQNADFKRSADEALLRKEKELQEERAKTEAALAALELERKPALQRLIETILLRPTVSQFAGPLFYRCVVAIERASGSNDLSLWTRLMAGEVDANPVSALIDSCLRRAPFDACVLLTDQLYDVPFFDDLSRLAAFDDAELQTALELCAIALTSASTPSPSLASLCGVAALRQFLDAAAESAVAQEFKLLPALTDFITSTPAACRSYFLKRLRLTIAWPELAVLMKEVSWLQQCARELGEPLVTRSGLRFDAFALLPKFAQALGLLEQLAGSPSSDEFAAFVRAAADHKNRDSDACSALVAVGTMILLTGDDKPKMLRAASEVRGKSELMATLPDSVRAITEHLFKQQLFQHDVLKEDRELVKRLKEEHQGRHLLALFGHVQAILTPSGGSRNPFALLALGEEKLVNSSFLPMQGSEPGVNWSLDNVNTVSAAVVDVLVMAAALGSKWLSRVKAPAGAHEAIQRIVRRISLLSQLLVCDYERVFTVLHAVIVKSQLGLREQAPLPTFDDISNWTQRFARKFVDPIVAAGAFRASCVFLRENAQLLSQKTSLADVLDEVNIGGADPLTAALFRITAQITVEQLSSVLARQPGVAAQHPFIVSVLDASADLTALGALWPMLQWHRLLSTQLSQRLSFEEAAIPVRDWVLSLKDAQAATDALNELRQGIRNLLPDFNVDSAPISAFVAADQQFQKTIVQLVQSQNRFLEKCRADAKACPALFAFAALASSSTVQLHAATPDCILRNDWDADILRNAQLGLRVGEGTCISFDLARIEADMAQLLLTGKKRIEGALPLFEYRVQKRVNITSLLTEVAAKVPQCAPPSHAASLAELVRSRQNHASLLQALENVLGFVRRSGGSTTDVLAAYCEKHTGTAAPGIRALVDAFPNVPLENALALYEALEDQIFDSLYAGSNFGSDEKSALSATEVKQIHETVAKMEENELSFVIGALRHTLLRCAIPDHTTTQPTSDQPLGAVLAVREAWPVETLDSKELLARLPQGLTLLTAWSAFREFSSRFKEKRMSLSFASPNAAAGAARFPAPSATRVGVHSSVRPPARFAGAARASGRGASLSGRT